MATKKIVVSKDERRLARMKAEAEKLKKKKEAAAARENAAKLDEIKEEEDK